MRMRSYIAAALVAAAATALAVEVIRPFEEPRRKPQEIAAVGWRPGVQCVIVLCCPEQDCWKQDIFKPYYLERGNPPLED